jgi:hypothetical protein
MGQALDKWDMNTNFWSNMWRKERDATQENEIWEKCSTRAWEITDINTKFFMENVKKGKKIKLKRKATCLGDKRYE